MHRTGTSQARRCLVLGAGGVLGAAWTAGALRALEQVEGWDPRSADLLMGTSAGAVLAAVLAAGVGTETLVNHQRGILAAADPPIDYDYDTGSGGALPPRPRARLGSRSLLRNSLPRFRKNPLPALYGFSLEGRGTLTQVGEMVESLHPGGSWPDRPSLRVVAMDYDGGYRTVFGDGDAPETTVPDAVMASCSVPGWYRPMDIDGRRYVDGGAYSASSIDLVDAEDFDEVVLLAPMAALNFDRPRSPVRWVERGWRRFITRRLLTEAGVLRHSGTPVRLLTPGPEDLSVIGANLMDPARRESVLETSLRTSAEALRRAVGHRFATM